MGLRKKRKYSWKISRGILNEKLKKANGFSEIEGEQKRNAGTTLIVKYVLRRSLIRSVKVTRERNVRREISIKRGKKRKRSEGGIKKKVSVTLRSMMDNNGDVIRTGKFESYVFESEFFVRFLYPISGSLVKWNRA